MTRRTGRSAGLAPPGPAALSPGPLVPSLEALGLRATLYLAGLLRAQAQRIPVAPTRHAALRALDTLQSLHLIEVPWPAERWQIRPDAEVTPMENLQWAYAWPVHERSHLLTALEDQLTEWVHNDTLDEQRSAVWEELAQWETEQFLEQQLRKHHFDFEWARDVAFVFRTAPRGLPIARWRYCCWAAVRQGASVAQRQGARDAAGIREAIFQEMHNRLRILVSGSTQLGMFTPFQAMPGSSVAQIFVQHVLPMDWGYWTQQRP